MSEQKMTRAPDDTRLPEKLQAAWDEFEEVAGNWHLCAKDPQLCEDERDPESCLPCSVLRAIRVALDEAEERGMIRANERALRVAQGYDPNPPSPYTPRKMPGVK